MWLCVGLTLLIGGVRADDARTTYEQTFGQREQQIRRPEDRAALAQDLLEAARSTGQHELKILYCRKAYEWGSRDLAGYAAAAEALDILQREDPDQRVWCLEGLEELYASAYRRNPNKLRLGTGQAQVLMELAEQQVEDARQAFELGWLDAGGVADTFRQAQRRVREAHNLYGRVISRARSDARRAEHLNRSDIAERLESFAREFESRQQRAAAQAEQLTQSQRRWIRLANAHKRFEQSPTDSAANTIAATYIIDFDRPELVPPAVVEHLPRSIAEPLGWACEPVVARDGDEAVALTEWYLRMLQQADTDAAREHVLVRAELYTRRARALEHDQAAGLADRVEMRRLAAGLNDPGQVDRLTGDLHARLHYQFSDSPGAPPALAATNASPDVNEHKPDRSAAEVRTPDDAIAARPDVDDNDNHTAAASPERGTTTRTGGRPMTICDDCGRKFFAGWGVETRTCPDCREGRDNIFDFGRD